MVKLTRLYDSGKVSASLFGVLLAAGCADIALALGRRQGPQQLNPSQEAAMKAAAGQWQPAVAAALQAHKQLLSYPRQALEPAPCQTLFPPQSRPCLDASTDHKPRLLLLILQKPIYVEERNVRETVSWLEAGDIDQSILIKGPVDMIDSCQGVQLCRLDPRHVLQAPPTRLCPMEEAGSTWPDCLDIWSDQCCSRMLGCSRILAGLATPQCPVRRLCLHLLLPEVTATAAGATIHSPSTCCPCK